MSQRAVVGIQRVSNTVETLFSGAYLASDEFAFFRTDTEVHSTIVIVDSESISLHVGHHQRVCALLVRGWWRGFSSTSIVLVSPPFQEACVRRPCLECFADDGALVVAEEIIAVDFALDIRPRVSVLFERECLVGDVPGYESGVVKPRWVSRLDEQASLDCLRSFFDIHMVTIVKN